MRSGEQKLYGAKLLFQFRVVVNGESSKLRKCELRIIHIRAYSARAALARAKKRGKDGELEYRNSENNPVHVEFVGVLDLMQLGRECEHDTVWYECFDMRSPMERRNSFIPAEEKLLAFRK